MIAGRGELAQQNEAPFTVQASSPTDRGEPLKTKLVGSVNKKCKTDRDGGGADNPIVGEGKRIATSHAFAKTLFIKQRQAQ